MSNKNKLIYGWGINDANHQVSIKKELPKINGKRRQRVVWVCPYYKSWFSMLNRCLNPTYQKGQPTYRGCTICEDWKYFSNFIAWVDNQPNKDWQNCELDKDFLSAGSKHYSPETCIYIPKNLNAFIINRPRDRGAYMLGVNYEYGQKSKPYRAHCNNPFKKKTEHLGIFATELEAHLAWQVKKHEHACRFADMQEDERVAKALMGMYAPDKDWTNK